MKKIALCVLAASSIMSSALMADNYVYVGGAMGKVENTDLNAARIGLGIDKVTELNILLGMKFSYYHGSLKDNHYNNSTVNGMDYDLHLGYAPFDWVAAYAIGSGNLQAYADETAAGFGYGAGIVVKPFKHLALAVEYKTYDMTHKSFDYDYDVLDAQIRFVW